MTTFQGPQGRYFSGKNTQALEQILIGHMRAITGEANQIFRPVTMLDQGVDGEVEGRMKKGGNATIRLVE